MGAEIQTSKHLGMRQPALPLHLVYYLVLSTSEKATVTQNYEALYLHLCLEQKVNKHMKDAEVLTSCV